MLQFTFVCWKKRENFIPRAYPRRFYLPTLNSVCSDNPRSAAMRAATTDWWDLENKKRRKNRWNKLSLLFSICYKDDVAETKTEIAGPLWDDWAPWVNFYDWVKVFLSFPSYQTERGFAMGPLLASKWLISGKVVSQCNFCISAIFFIYLVIHSHKIRLHTPNGTLLDRFGRWYFITLDDPKRKWYTILAWQGHTESKWDHYQVTHRSRPEKWPELQNERKINNH